MIILKPILNYNFLEGSGYVRYIGIIELFQHSIENPLTIIFGNGQNYFETQITSVFVNRSDILIPVSIHQPLIQFYSIYGIFGVLIFFPFYIFINSRITKIKSSSIIRYYLIFYPLQFIAAPFSPDALVVYAGIAAYECSLTRS
tara:strand:- start:232 stop:663 length:432 start_codon:yes stop_codon:yes gene_type:complete